MDDLISRRAAIKALDEWFKKAKYPLNWGEYNQGEIDAYVTAIDTLKTLPAVQPEPHWIPCSEKLPEKEQQVLVSDGSVVGVCEIIRTDYGYMWRDTCGYWFNFDEWDAWMPLPEPYRGGEMT